MSTEDVGIELQPNTTGEQIKKRFLIMSSELQNKINETLEVDELPEGFAKQLEKIHSTECKPDFSVNGRIQILDTDQFGIIKRVRCVSCKKEIPILCRPDAPVYRVRIESLSDLSPGDHIAWHRLCGYWHHAIFLEGLTSESEGCFRHCWLTDKRVKVIAYSYNSKNKTIQVEESEENLEGVDVYRYEYDECYLPDYTIELAKKTAVPSTKRETSALDEEIRTQYDPLTENCEHFARRCKTGQSDSYQVQDCRKACCKNFLMSLWRLVILAIWTVCEWLVKDTEEGNEHEKKKLSEMELYMSVTLSGLFAFLYCLYAVCSEFSKIRKSDEDRENNNEPTDIQTNAKNCCIYSNVLLGHNGRLARKCPVCFRISRLVIWICCCKLLCRMCYECVTYCRGYRNSCFLRNCRCSFKACRLCCKIYCNVVIRVIIRELVAIGTPILVFFVYEHFLHAKLFANNSSTITALNISTISALNNSTILALNSSTISTLDSSTISALKRSTIPALNSSTITTWNSSTTAALIGFAISVAVAQISLPIGVLLGSLAEHVFLLLLLHVFCRSNGAQRAYIVLQGNEEVASV